MKNFKNAALRERQLIRRAALIAVVVAAITFFTTAVFYIADISQRQGLLLTRQAVTRTAVECYASEGIYPPSVKYMEENYGLKYDHTKYVIFYDAFASNIMPEIEIYEKR
jgi:hypothetical protein